MCSNTLDHDAAGGNKPRVNGAFYRDQDPNVPVPEDGRPHCPDQIVAVEFKCPDLSLDPFSSKRDSYPEAEERKSVREQLIKYAEVVFSVQHRVSVFMFVVMGRWCRITRWDRSGVVFTTLLDYCEKWELFCSLLWRMSQCSDEQLGRDPTATRVYAGDALYKAMDDAAAPRDSDIDHAERILGPNELPPDTDFVFRYVREMFHNSLSNDAPRYVLEVPDGDTSRQFLVGKPVFVAKGIAGRGTRGFIALDWKTRDFVWLKDSWQANHAGADCEGDVLKELNAAGVPNVPTVICYGDINDQKTVTQTAWDLATEEQSDPVVDLATRTSELPPLRHPNGSIVYTLDLDAHATPQHQRASESTSSVQDASASEGRGDASAALRAPSNKTCPLRLHRHTRLVVKEIALPLKEFQHGKQLLFIVADCIDGERY